MEKVLWDTHHWHSQTLLSTCIIYLHQHCPKVSTLGHDWGFSWDAGRKCLRGPHAEMGSPLSKWPPEPQGKSTGSLKYPETASPPVSSGLQELAVQNAEGENNPNTQGPTGSTAWAGRRQVWDPHLRPPPHPPTVRGRTWSQIKWGPGLGCAMELLSPTPNHHPAQAEGGTAGHLHLCLHTKHTRRRIVTTISINKAGQIQSQQKQEPSCWLQGRRAHGTAGPGPEEHTNTMIHPTKPTPDSLIPQTPAAHQPTLPRYSKKAFLGGASQPSWKGGWEKSGAAELAEGSQRERTALGHLRVAACRQIWHLHLYTKVTKSNGDIILHLLSIISQC